MTLYLGCNPAVFVQLIADCCRRCLRGWLWLKREFCGDFIWLTFEKMCIFVIRFAFVCVCKRERDHSVSCHRKMCSVSCCCIVSCCCKCVQAWGGRGVTGSRSSRLHRFSAAHSCTQQPAYCSNKPALETCVCSYRTPRLRPVRCSLLHHIISL